MQGIFVNYKRPTSKKQVRELVALGSTAVRLEATSLHGNEYDGPVADAPDGTYYFVGPDPYTKRSFYGSITVRGGVAKVK